MPITLDVRPELEAAIRAAAAREQLSPEDYLLWAVVARLPGDACPDVIREYFAEYRAREAARRAAAPADDDDDIDWDEFARNINANHAGPRPPFPPEMKGILW